MIVICIIIILFFVFLGYMSFQQRSISHEDARILANVYDDDIKDEYKANNVHSERQKMNYIRKNYPEKWEKAILRCKISDEQHAISLDKDRKQKIANRMFAYEYEEDLYKLYSKYAHVEHRQYTSADKTVGRKKLCEHLMTCRNLTEEEAYKLIEELVKHEVLFDGYVGICLSSMIDGRFYGSYWDVVSDRDLNLHKWMIQNGYKDPKDNN